MLAPDLLWQRPMRAVLLFTAVLLSAPGLARAADSWTDPFPGVRRLHRTTSSQNINVLKVDLCAPGVSVRGTATGERRKTVSSFASGVGAQAAINGDFFSFETYSTNGPSMSGGAAWGGNDHNYVAPVQFGPGQVALPGHQGTGGVAAWAREVVSGHPSLISGGTRRDNNGDSLCTARHPRTAAGFSADKRTLVLAVVDGRATGRIGMTCDELSGLMAEMGAADAVNLDGGGSSTMWVQGPGVVNIPSDGSQRVVANHLAIRATGSGAAAHCPLPAYAAGFVALEAPDVMVSGEEAIVWMEYKNDGRTTWDLQQTRIGTQDPQDRASPFFKEGNWLSPSRASGADHSNYGPGAVGRFTWIMKAPEVEEETVFEETFQPVQEGVTWFGAPQTMTITVVPREVGEECPEGEEGCGEECPEGEEGCGEECPEGDPGCSEECPEGVEGCAGDEDGNGADDASEQSGGCAAGGAAGAGALPLLFALVAVRRRRRR